MKDTLYKERRAKSLFSFQEKDPVSLLQWRPERKQPQRDKGNQKFSFFRSCVFYLRFKVNGLRLRHKQKA